MSFFSVSFSQEKNPLLTEDYHKQIEWADSIYNGLSLDEKIGQLFMLRISSAAGQKSYDRIEKNISQNHIGGLIFSKGSPSISRATTVNWKYFLPSRITFSSSLGFGE